MALNVRRAYREEVVYAAYRPALRADHFRRLVSHVGVPEILDDDASASKGAERKVDGFGVACEAIDRDLNDRLIAARLKGMISRENVAALSGKRRSRTATVTGVLFGRPWDNALVLIWLTPIWLLARSTAPSVNASRHAARGQGPMA